MLSTADRPLISIIINCFNGEKYLNEAITKCSTYALTIRNCSNF